MRGYLNDVCGEAHVPVSFSNFTIVGGVPIEYFIARQEQSYAIDLHPSCANPELKVGKLELICRQERKLEAGGTLRKQNISSVIEKLSRLIESISSAR